MLGKEKCRILKEIRRKIADENDIPFVTEECTHKGNCRGTCPRCESELRYLEKQLERRTALGKTVTLAALCTGIVLTASGCSPLDVLGNGTDVITTTGLVPYTDPGKTADPHIEVETGEVEWAGELMGEIAPFEDGDPDADEAPVIGEETESSFETELSGMIAYGD